MLSAAATATRAQTPLHVFVHLLLGFWPLWALITAAGAGRVLVYAWRWRRLRRAGIFEIDRMDGHTFERRLAVLFRSLGYRAEVIGRAGGDFGGDLLVARSGEKTVVQAKCWRKNVGVKAVQEVVGARGYYGADAALVVTNARFTKQAEQLARKNNVVLWGRDELVKALLESAKHSLDEGPTRDRPVTTAEPSAATEPSYPAPEVVAVRSGSPTVVTAAVAAFCARCGEPVSFKVRDYCLANPKRFRGLVYCYEDQRAFSRRPSS